jgi:pSer/pThr/pTyr-binding forkhead associated (FHA) protein
MPGLYRALGALRRGPDACSLTAPWDTLRTAMARLRVVSGPAAGRTVDVEQEVVIGREDTDLDIDDLELSRRHAVIRRFANRLQVEDLGSTNGTFVDGNRIAQPTLLGGGAEIKIGTTVLVVEGVLPVGSSETGRELGDVSARNMTRVSPAVGAGTSVGSPQAAAGADATASPAAGSAASPAASSAASAAAPSAAPVTSQPLAQAQPTQPLAPFHPPSQRRQKGLASRSWIPVALSFGTVIVVAIALVIYFSQHT